MRALRLHERGGPEHLVEEEAPLPSPGIGDALIRVHVSVVEPPAVTRGRCVFFVVEPNREQLAAVGAEVASGKLRPVVGSTWPLREGRAAFEAKGRGRLPGKSVLRIVA
jgi:NADPH:quinone reductase-like Zn-dependent oxidoreductase